QSVERMIQSLEQTKRAAETEADEAHQLLEASEETKQAVEAAWQAFEKERDQLYKQAEEKAAKAVEKARKEAEAIVDTVKNMKNKALNEHEWIAARKAFDEQKLALSHKEESRQEQQVGALQVGDEIRHSLLQQAGEIIEAKTKDEFVVQIGNMKLTANKKDLTFIGRAKTTEAVAPKTSHTVSANKQFSPELDLRGERYDDAMIRSE